MKKENVTTEYRDREDKAAQRQLKYSEALDNFSQRETEEPKKKKHRWLTPLVLIISIAIGVVLTILMSKEMGDQKDFSAVFGSVSAANLALALSVLLIVLFLDICKYAIPLKAITGKVHPLISTKTSFLGRYYDNITPFAVGGQPIQIYYLHGKGFGGGRSSAVVLIKYFFNNTAWTMVGFICMACNTGVLASVPNGVVILIFGWIGLAINMSLPMFILFFAIMPKFAEKITNGVITLGYKMHIVRNKEKVMKRAKSVVQDFRSSFRIMAQNPVKLVLLVLVCIAETSLIFALPYFIIKMFNGMPPEEQTFKTAFSVMALNCYSFFSASIVPTPGGSGIIELIATVAFSGIAEATLTWVIFTWRFATYYIYILIGVGITTFNFIRNVVRTRKSKVLAAAAEAPATEASDATPEPAEPARQDITTEPAERIVEVEFTSNNEDSGE